MRSPQRVEEAAALMTRFADRSGLSSGGPPQRYLWTDAFAVCNFLGLAEATGEGRYFELALRLVDQVHHVLGRHRADDARRGWLSGLDDAEGERHPTRGGLRIGKRLPERGRGEPIDEGMEWERDGQYFHYLTRWMHALDQVARVTGQAQFCTWALELAEVASEAFVAPDGKRMAWKLSLDLSRPLVDSMGHHDPLDGFLTVTQLRATAARLSGARPVPAQQALEAFARLIEGRDWATGDPLGIGGLMIDAFKAEQLLPDSPLAETLLSASFQGLSAYLRQGSARAPPWRRLPFRELGLAIGLHGIERMTERPGWKASALPALRKQLTVGVEIEETWRDPEHQRLGGWQDHLDISEVMLATALVPEGYLVLAPPIPR